MRAHSVPFIARYRKEGDRQLDDTNCVIWKSACATCVKWKTRRNADSSSPALRQGKLTAELERDHPRCRDPTTNRLEDLYLPYKIANS